MQQKIHRIAEAVDVVHKWQRDVMTYLHRVAEAVDVAHKWQRDVMTYLHRIAVAVDEMLGAVRQCFVKTPVKVNSPKNVRLRQTATGNRRSHAIDKRHFN